MSIKASIKKRIPAFVFRSFSKAGLYKSYIPEVGKINFGDLNRVTPFNKKYGYSRGGPIDRYYIEAFLQKNAAAIKGRVLEVSNNTYTKRFGGTRVVQSDILHINKENKKATIIGDLSNAPHIPDNSFDCIILTQTLQFIYDCKGAIATCHRILQPNGVLLITVPGISQIGPDAWKWYWSFTADSIRRILSEVFVADDIAIDTYGNVLAATAFLYGMGLPEIKKQQLDHHDKHYQLIVAAKAVKRG